MDTVPADLWPLLLRFTPRALHALRASRELYHSPRRALMLKMWPAMLRAPLLRSPCAGHASAVGAIEWPDMRAWQHQSGWMVEIALRRFFCADFLRRGNIVVTWGSIIHIRSADLVDVLQDTWHASSLLCWTCIGDASVVTEMSEFDVGPPMTSRTRPRIGPYNVVARAGGFEVGGVVGGSYTLAKDGQALCHFDRLRLIPTACCFSASYFVAVDFVTDNLVVVDKTTGDVRSWKPSSEWTGRSADARVACFRDTAAVLGREAIYLLDLRTLSVVRCWRGGRFTSLHWVGDALYFANGSAIFCFK